MGERSAKRIRPWLVGLVLTVGLVALACGGEAEEPGVAGPSPTETAEAATVTPGPLPTVEGNRVTSSARGYAVTFPEGWQPRFNVAAIADASADAYLAPAEDTEAQTNIVVGCQWPVPQGSPQSFFDDQLDMVRAVIGQEPRTASVTVSGQPALRIEYSYAPIEAPALDRVEVLVVGARCAYMIALSTPKGEGARLVPALDAFLASFQILP